MATLNIHETNNRINVYTEGRPGPTGASGSSAYDIWLDAGNSGSQSDFLNSLIGPSGSSGSGSATLPSGLVSSSQQINYSGISNVPPGILSSSNGFISSSQQVNYSEINGVPTGILSGSISFNNLIDKPTLISGSGQVNYNQLQNIPAGLLSSSNGFISASNQVDYNLIQNQPTSILSASYALTASYVSGSNSSSVSSSYAVTSSYALTASYFNGIIPSSSYSQTASFATNIQTIGIRIKTDDSFIIAGSKGYKHIGYNSNIVKLRSVANIAGNININVKRDGLLLGNYQLLNQSSSLDTTLTNWTSSLNTNDLIEFYVSQSSTYITDITFFMDLQNR